MQLPIRLHRLHIHPGQLPLLCALPVSHLEALQVALDDATQRRHRCRTWRIIEVCAALRRPLRGRLAGQVGGAGGACNAQQQGYQLKDKLHSIYWHIVGQLHLRKGTSYTCCLP